MEKPQEYTDTIETSHQNGKTNKEIVDLCANKIKAIRSIPAERLDDTEKKKAVDRVGEWAYIMKYFKERIGFYSNEEYEKRKKRLVEEFQASKGVREDVSKVFSERERVSGTLSSILKESNSDIERNEKLNQVIEFINDKDKIVDRRTANEMRIQINLLAVKVDDMTEREFRMLQSAVDGRSSFTKFDINVNFNQKRDLAGAYDYLKRGLRSSKYNRISYKSRKTNTQAA